MIDCRQMKKNSTLAFAVLAGVAILVVGCIRTVSGNKAGAIPFKRDRIEGRYERPMSAVYQAAKEVLQFNGMVTAESTLSSTNTTALALEGKVNQRSVWIRVEQVEPQISSVVVQARNKWGGSDMDLVHELEKEIALKLVR
jgi:Protein of unknown function (DUF3568)